MRFLWATRGRTWGFRILSTGGETRPLLAYEAAFATVPSTDAVWQPTAQGAPLRFSDPLERTDRAGRVIPHEFVLWGSDAQSLSNLDEARAAVWPLVEDFYAAHWQDQTGPTFEPPYP